MEGFPLVLMYSLLFPSMNDQGSGKWDCDRLYAQMIMSQISNAWDFLALLGWLKGSHQLWGVGVDEPQWDPHTRTDCIQSLAKGWRCFDQLTCTRPSSTRCAWQVGGTKAWHVWWVWEFYSAIVIWCYLQRGLFRRRMFYLCFFLRLFRWYIAYNVGWHQVTFLVVTS